VFPQKVPGENTSLPPSSLQEKKTKKQQQKKQFASTFMSLSPCVYLGVLLFLLKGQLSGLRES
jgi:hypothetical protein